MQVHDATDGAALNRLVLQPEDDPERVALNRLFEVFRDLDGGDVPLVRFTLDVPEYEDLDHGRWREAEYAPDRDRYDPGARALVIPTNASPDWGFVHQQEGKS